MDEDAPPPPLPLWAPFGLLGAAATFFSTLGISILVTDVRFTAPWPALAVGAVVGAVAGELLRRWRKLQDPWLTSAERLVRVGSVVVVAGAACGAIVAWSGGGRPADALAGAANGAGCALLFVPGAAFLRDAAARATRARHGSLVAAVDRRSVWATALSVVTVAPVVAVPATSVGLVSRALGPHLQPLLVMGCAAAGLLALAALELADRRARAHLEALLAEVDDLSPAGAHDTRAAAARDLGVGDAAFSRLRPRDAYRGARHGDVVLRGDPDEAREAIEDALGRRRRARILGVLALLGAAFALVGYGDTSRTLLRAG